MSRGSPGGNPRDRQAGDISRHLGTPHNTMSTHLGLLVRAGLVTSRREGRSVIYVADYAGVRGLIAFLLQDCCKGRPEVCAPLLDAALPASYCPTNADRRPT